MADVYRAAPSRTLGAIERKHASPPPVRGIVTFFVIFGLPAIALISGFQSGPGEVFAGDRVTNGAIGAALLGFTVFLVVMAVRKATLSVTVHERGLRWVENGKTRDVFWEDIESITGAHRSRLLAGAEMTRTDVHRIKLADGRVLVMTNLLADVRALADRVESALLARLVPQLRDGLAEGRPIVFGPITLTKTALEHEKRHVPLPTRVVVENGVISFGSEAHIAVEWSKVPNARVLLALLDQG